MSKLNPIKFENDTLTLLDQRKLPHEEVYTENKTIEDVFNGIKDMVVRGAPCIGFSGIFGIALWLNKNEYEKNNFRKACDYLISARPTAVNLAYEIDRCYKIVVELENKKDAYSEIV